MVAPFFRSDDRDFTLIHKDCVEVLRSLVFSFDTIFDDPSYFLSNGGIGY